jgi:integrase/recombinase XerD
MQETPPYELQTDHYKTKLKEFTTYLYTLGYNKHSIYSLPNYVKEFFFQLEKATIYHNKDITPKHIQEHYNYLCERPNYRSGGTLSSSSIKTHIYAIRLYLDWRQVSGELTINPISSLIFPRVTTNQREILSQQEIKELYKVAETLKDKAILALFYGCGLRRTEAEQLDIRDIHFSKQLLFVREGKGKKRRVIPINKTITEDLENYYLNERGLGVGAFMFNKRGHRMKGERYYTRIKELVQLTGNPELKTKQIGLHSLRHSIASHLLENGIPVEYIREFLGHEFLETTQIYTRVNTKQLQTNFKF